MEKPSSGWNTSAMNSTKDGDESMNVKRKKGAEMQGAVLHGARDIRFADRSAPTIVKPTDAIISRSATCICGSDLWP